MRKRILWLAALAAMLAACGPKTEKEVVMVVETTMGTVEFKLYNETPLHRDNFIRLAEEHYFDSLLFHRVIDDFVIQGGDPNSKYAKPGEMLGDGEPDFRVPAEIRVDQGITCVKGSILAAREGDDVNPQRESCASQYCFMMRPCPHLDGAYTVFGEVTEGMDVLEAIQKVATDENDRPLEDIRMLKVYRKE
ncbi:MAG: peptidylprolyl isomerase [Bacteroidales bacterium]|jgi:peptidyl-prolyl cis-trans isomerase B (cyclophilin B)|nr:peptidylprolyl isomerase [Bacteroidales bacterium]